MEIKEYSTFDWDDLEKWSLDANGLARKMGIEEDNTFDTTLPKMWLDIFIKTSGLDYHKVIYSTFMIYSKNDYFGMPYSAWNVCAKAINRGQIEWIKDILSDKCTEIIKEDMNRLCGIDMQEASGNLSRDIISSLDKWKFKWSTK